jgi:tRNA A37 threonylcarbamoyladenosine synthetase subunit TsaC/SUA5/YrdC
MIDGSPFSFPTDTVYSLSVSRVKFSMNIVHPVTQYCKQSKAIIASVSSFNPERFRVWTVGYSNQ